MAKNEVIAGDYAGRKVKCNGKRIFFDKGLKTPVEVSDATVSSYEVVDQENSKSVLSAFGRGFIGNALFGPLGMIAGVASAKSTSSVIVSIEFLNGDKSLVEIDKNTYKTLMKILYR